MSFYDAIRVGASGATDFEIKRSLRFEYLDSSQLKRTGSSTSSSYTISMWFKYTGVQRNELNLLFSLGQQNDANSAFMGIDNNDRFVIYSNGSYQFTSTRVYRDPSAWYHFLLSVNSNSYNFYINNESIDTGTIRSLDTSSDGLRIGIQYGNYYPFSGYIADFYLIDGSALTPSSFTETNSETGQLNPIEYSGSFGTSGAHLLFDDNSGTTATTLGKDSSGNGNNFTPSGFSVSAGVDNDSVTDTPTNNFSTLNQIYLTETGRGVLNGNLDYKSDSNYSIAAGNFSLKTGKWYWEVTITAAMSGSNGQINGIVRGNGANHNAYVSYDTNGNVFGIGYVYNGSIQGASPDGSTNSPGGASGLATYTNNDVLGFASDIPNGTLAIYKNGSLQTTITGLNSHDWFPAVSGYGTTSTCSLNFGQRTFAHTPPTGHLALNSKNLPDPIINFGNQHFNTILYTANGQVRSLTGVGFQPDWVWIKSRIGGQNNALFDSVRGVNRQLRSDTTGAELTGYTNLVTSFDSDGFSLGTDSNVGDVNYNSQPHVAWNWNAGNTDSATYTVKVVSDSGNKYRFNDFGTSAVTLDLAEGGTYTFDQSDSSMSSHPMQLSTTANGTHGGGSAYSTGVTYQLDGSTVTASAFISGFSSASSRKLIITVAASAPTLYYYCYYHSGMGGQVNTNSTLGSSNFDGSIQTTVKVNASAGFSIVTYTGTGADATIGHGLGVTPNAAITKKRSGTKDWLVKHSAAGSGKVGYLNLNDQFDNSGSGGGIISDFSSSTNYSVTRYNNTGNYGNVNESSDTYVSYVFSEVAGYSKFGSYKGNGSADGSFIYLGFKPAWIMFKSNTSSSVGWYILDRTRNPTNVVNKHLQASSNGQEQTDSFADFLANGFKFRTSDSSGNADYDYIYFAFAESPFKNNRAR